jgi:hypothetical protein
MTYQNAKQRLESERVIRDNLDFAKYQTFLAQKRAEKLQALATDLQELGFLGLGNGVSIQDVQSQIDAALNAFLASNDLQQHLADYVKSQDLQTTLNNYVTTGALTNALSAYTTQAQRAQDLANYVSNAALTSTLTNYITGGALNSALNSYVSQTAFNAALSTYVSTGALSTTLNNYVSTGALTAALSSYVTSSALTTALQSYVSTGALTTALASYVSNAGLSTTLTNYITSGALTAALSSYVTSSALTTALQSYVSTGALTTALASYVSNASLSTTLASFVKKGTNNTIAATNDAINCTDVVLQGVDNIAINCKYLTINSTQQNSIFENINYGPSPIFVMPKVPESSRVYSLSSVGFGKKLVVESGFYNNKPANGSTLIMSNLVKPKAFITLVSTQTQTQNCIAVHEIEVIAIATAQYKKILAIVSNNNPVEIISIANIGNLNIAVTQNATTNTDLDISVSAGGIIATVSVALQTVIKSIYNLGA